MYRPSWPAAPTMQTFITYPPFAGTPAFLPVPRGAAVEPEWRSGGPPGRVCSAGDDRYRCGPEIPMGERRRRRPLSGHAAVHPSVPGPGAGAVPVAGHGGQHRPVLDINIGEHACPATRAGGPVGDPQQLVDIAMAAVPGGDPDVADGAGVVAERAHRDVSDGLAAGIPDDEPDVLFLRPGRVANQRGSPASGTHRRDGVGVDPVERPGGAGSDDLRVTAGADVGDRPDGHVRRRWQLLAGVSPPKALFLLPQPEPA